MESLNGRAETLPLMNMQVRNLVRSITPRLDVQTGSNCGFGRYQRVPRTFGITLVVCALTLCNAVDANASDWINGDATMYREVPRNNVVPPPPSARRNANVDDGAVSVTDPGVAGSAPEQNAPQALQGNVNQFNSAYASSFYASDARQAPLAFAPQARIVSPKVYQGWLQQTHPSLGTHLKNEVVNIKGHGTIHRTPFTTSE